MVETAKIGTNHETKMERVRFERCIVALVGIPLAGKTTLGKELARRSNLEFLDVNAARLEIFLGGATRLLIDRQEQFVMIHAYQRNHELARNLLLKNQPVAIEATYSREIYHEMLKELAKITKSPLRVFFLDAPSDEEIAQRVRKRQEENLPTTVVKTAVVALEIKNRYQLITGVYMERLDPNQPLEEKVEKVLNCLADLRSS